MAVTKQKKEDILQGLIEKFSRSKSIVFTQYRGLNVKGISELRSRLRANNSEMQVAKKTLLRLAAKQNKIDDIGDNIMDGPVSATFSYEDELAGLQVLFKFSKENDKLVLVGGIIDGKVLGSDDIKKYAQLPGREELIAKLMGSINAPVSNFVGLLGNVIGSFVRVVNAYKDTLPADEVAEVVLEKPVPSPTPEAAPEPTTKAAPEAVKPTAENAEGDTGEGEGETPEVALAKDTEKPADDAVEPATEEASETDSSEAEQAS